MRLASHQDHPLFGPDSTGTTGDSSFIFPPLHLLQKNFFSTLGNESGRKTDGRLRYKLQKRFRNNFGTARTEYPKSQARAQTKGKANQQDSELLPDFGTRGTLRTKRAKGISLQGNVSSDPVGNLVGTSRTFQHILSQLGTASHN